jgi:PAS domain S-box-containing protein
MAKSKSFSSKLPWFDDSDNVAFARELRHLRMGMRWYWLRSALETAILAVAYVGAAKLGLRLGFVEQVSAVWAPSGIALAAVLLYGYRLLPAIALGALLANITANESMATACTIAIGNTLEAFTGAWLLRRFTGFNSSLKRVKDVLGLVLLGAALSTMISATLGVTSLCVGGLRPWREFPALWGVWWLGDATGVLVVAPLLLTLGNKPRPTVRLRRLAEGAVLIFGLVAVSLTVFGGGFTRSRGGYPLEYVIFPFVIWSGLRFTPLMTSFVNFLTCCFALLGTLSGVGPLAAWPYQESLVLLQIFMAVAAVTGLVLTAVSTERRLAEEQLRGQHGLLEAIFEGTTDAMFVKDLRGRYLMINSAGARLLGKSVGQVLHKDDAQLFSPDSAHAIMTRDLKVMASGFVQTYEEVGTAAGVTRTYLSTKGPYRDHQGRVVGLIGISRDITDRKQLEEQLRQRAADLATADKRKDEFLAMLAHELRNPLAPIQNAVYAMTVPQLDPERLRWAQDIIARQVRQMTRLVDDLLDVSRITRDTIALRMERVDLASLIGLAVETSRPLIDSRHHELQVDLPPAPIMLDADPTRLAQVLANLLNNAAKYTKPRGRIRISAESSARFIIVRVRDNGVGIPSEMLSRIFDLFQQLDRSTGRFPEGLGIGLTLAKKLVEMHGGTIEAQSQGLGKGSEFVVQLPKLEARALVEPSPIRKNESLPSKSRRILAVDDSVDSTETLAVLLRQAGHEVVTANSATDALAQTVEFRPDVVFLDIAMPVTDGLKLARQIRMLPGFEAVQLVALTGYGQEEDRRRCRDAGFDVHFTKPVDPAALRDFLDNLSAAF